MQLLLVDMDMDTNSLPMVMETKGGETVTVDRAKHAEFYSRLTFIK